MDFVVVPLVKGVFNYTSEMLYAYLSCSIFDIPLVAPNMFPYTKYISEKLNGYLYKSKPDLINTIDDMFSNTELMKHIGLKAKEDVRRNHSFTELNIEILSEVYDEKQE